MWANERVSLSIRIEGDGTRTLDFVVAALSGMSRFMSLFPPLLCLRLVAFFGTIETSRFGVEGLRHLAWPALPALCVAVLFPLLISPIMSKLFASRTRTALEMLLSNAATNSAV